MVELNEISNDIENVISRLERTYAVAPVEILNLYTALISHIIEKYSIVNDGIGETVPKSVFIINHNLWLYRDKYSESHDLRRNKCRDHNDAYHLWQLKYMRSMCEKLNIIEEAMDYGTE